MYSYENSFYLYIPHIIVGLPFKCYLRKAKSNIELRQSFRFLKNPFRESFNILLFLYQI